MIFSLQLKGFIGNTSVHDTISQQQRARRTEKVHKEEHLRRHAGRMKAILLLDQVGVMGKLQRHSY